LEDSVALCVLVCLPDVVKGGMGLLGVGWAELIEEAFKDGWGSKHDDFGAYLLETRLVSSILTKVRLNVGDRRLTGPS
jgi:hypothetical protein